MRAKAKNTLLALVVGLPVAIYFPVNTWQFWIIGLAAFEIFYFATLALPVFADRVPRRDGR